MKKLFFIVCQYVLPQHVLSRLAGKLADTSITWIKNRLIRTFIQQYDIDMSIAKEPKAEKYVSFNDFFTRALAEGQRPICETASTIACPADGAISQLGNISQDQLFQAKGHYFSVSSLLGGDLSLAKQFNNGIFATIYLSPRDYHRVHMPLKGELQSMTHIPGDLFSVNQTTASRVPQLFARNERVVCLFETEAGPMALVLVGAMIVASIETVWAGLIAPQKQQVRTWHYASHKTDAIQLEKGEEMGRFKLGSTVIVLFGEQVAQWQEQLQEGSSVKMGEAIGELIKNA